MTSAVQVTQVPRHDPAAVALRRAMYDDLAARYPAETAAVEADGGFPARDARAGREARGRGVGRALLERAGALARTHGLEVLVLETGVRQEAALRLYRGAGWREVPRFAPHTDDPTSVCLALRLA